MVQVRHAGYLMMHGRQLADHVHAGTHLGLFVPADQFTAVALHAFGRQAQPPQIELFQLFPDLLFVQPACDELGFLPIKVLNKVGIQPADRVAGCRLQQCRAVAR